MHTVMHSAHLPKSGLWSLLLLPFSEHLQSLSQCLAVFRGQLLSMSWISTFDNSRPVEIICHSEKPSVNLTRWASAHGLSRSSAGNFDSCSSRLWGLTTTRDKLPSAVLSDNKYWVCPAGWAVTDNWIRSEYLSRGASNLVFPKVGMVYNTRMRIRPDQVAGAFADFTDGLLYWPSK